MTLEQLRIFIAVAEREHMTRAAEALNLTQSATSAAIAALEAAHAVRLFHRIGRRIELTEAGRLFLDEARAVVARAAAAERTLSELGGLERGTLTIQASQTIASYVLPRFLVAFRRRHPGIEIALSISNTALTGRALIEGTAELGFVEGALDEPALAGAIVGYDQLVLVVGADHPWAAAEEIAVGALAASPWVLRESGSGTRSEFEALLAEHGLSARDLPIALELPSNEAVRAAVEAGAGATVISEYVAAAGLASGRLRRVPFALPRRPFHAVWHRERYRSGASAAFVAGKP